MDNRRSALRLVVLPVVGASIVVVLSALAAVTVLFARLASSDAVAPPAADALAAPRDDVPSDWTRVDTGPFSVALPPGWRYEPRQGEDSFVGQLVGDGLTLTFDLGMFWNSPPADTSRHDVSAQRVDFRAAHIFRPHDPHDILGLFIEHTDDFGALGSPKHLSIVGRDVPLGDQDRVVQIFRSVRFRRLITDGGRWVSVDPPAGQTLLQDVDLLNGPLPWVLGIRLDAGPSRTDAMTTAFQPTDAGWVEHPLRGDHIWPRAIAGGWAVVSGSNDGALYHFDSATAAWRRERTVGEKMLLTDAAVDGRADADGWAIGSGGVIRLANGRSTETDGGWGTVRGYAVDILPRAPLPSEAHPSASDAMVVGAGQGASLFDGRRWSVMHWDTEGFEGTNVDLVGADEAWLVGGEQRGEGGGGFRHRVGGDFTSAPVTAPNILWSIDMLSPAEGWAVGGLVNNQSPAELWRFRDGVWERLPSPCQCHLNAVQAMPNGEAWAVGDWMDQASHRVGVVLHYVPDASAATGTPPAMATAATTPTAAAPTAAATVAAVRGRAIVPWVGREQRR